MHVEDTWTRRNPISGRRTKTTRWGKGRRWRARWTAPDGTRQSATFTTRAAAKTHLTAHTTTHQQPTSNPPAPPPADPALHLPPITHQPADRPLENGGIPGFSNAGYLCYLAQLLDPLNPLDMTDGNTTRRTHHRNNIEHQARILTQAILNTETPTR